MKVSDVSQKPQPEPVSIDLHYEYEMDGTTVTRLTMRPPQARDLRDAQRAAPAGHELEVRLFSNLCGVAPELLLDLHIRDYFAVQEVYRGFTGERS